LFKEAFDKLNMKDIDANNGHYKGLVAAWYDDLLAGETKDIDYYTEIIQPKDAPVLELASGTGRVLLELLKRGVPTDGLDLSQPMLDICKRKIEAGKFQSNLYKQDFSTFELGKSYQTIFVSGGSFQLMSTTELAMKALQQIYKHLNPGGRFICDLWISWDEIVNYEPNIWKTGRVATRPNGHKLVVTYSKTFDMRNQLQQGIFKYEWFKDGNLVDTNLDEIKLKWFGVEEFEYMLEKAGFKNISNEERPMMSSHGVSSIYTARR
jgi:SAM-dependent methyltransferase